ncbi:MAG: SRPBCC family protein [Candidatus Aminicenantes bacterium]|nr:SRPBCC family protein [Candidatus Aminicenantes bacterium]
MAQCCRKLKRESFVPASIETVFDFFSRAENLDRITPPWLHFQIRTPAPVKMEKGTIIDYALRLHGIPMKWRSQITEWEAPLRFVDVQIRGPYTRWRHSHRFERRGAGTVMTDDVEYIVPGGIAECFIHFLLVRRDLKRIFNYREAIMSNTFGKGD